MCACAPGHATWKYARKLADLSLEDKVVICPKIVVTGSYRNCRKYFENVSQTIINRMSFIGFDCWQGNFIDISRNEKKFIAAVVNLSKSAGC